MVKSIKSQIEEQRLFYSKPILIGEKIAVKVLTVRNKHFGILDGVNIPGKIMVSIEPKYVFGDGAHITSRMCIEAVERYIRPDDKVLDIGCGTGILSVVSLLLGADHVDAVDIGENAVKAAIENAELNGVADRFSCFQNDLTENLSGKYDLIVANILADPILRLLENLRDFTHDESVVILSGVNVFREAGITDAVVKNFDIIEKETRENWVCYVLRPKK